MSEIEKKFYIEKFLFLCNNVINHDNTKSLIRAIKPLVFRRGYTRGF